jgi:hypothetical protein
MHTCSVTFMHKNPPAAVIQLHPENLAVIGDCINSAGIRKLSFSLNDYTIAGAELEPFFCTERGYRVKGHSH